MEFFTLDWWIGDEGDPFPAYAAHVAAIARLMPPDLLRLAQDQTCWLHDSRLRELAFDAAIGDLKLSFDAPDGQGGFTRRLHLQYLGVERLKSVADPKKGLIGRHGYGDLGYDEIDVAQGVLVHRLLFSTGIELEIQFRDFSLAGCNSHLWRPLMRKAAVEDRDFPASGTPGEGREGVHSREFLEQAPSPALPRSTGGGRNGVATIGRYTPLASRISG